MMPRSRIQITLLLGDMLVLALVTLYGFFTHNTLTTAGDRMLTTYLPWLAAWLLLAPHLKVYDETLVTKRGELWRPFWAMILASPIAGFLRSVWLGGSVVVLFVAIFGAISAVGILIWRGLYWMVRKRREGSP